MAAQAVSARETIEAFTSLELGSPSDGDERCCGGCDSAMPAGDPVWWTGGDDGDPYCEACAERTASANRTIVEALDRGEIIP